MVVRPIYDSRRCSAPPSSCAGGTGTVELSGNNRVLFDVVLHDPSVSPSGDLIAFDSFNDSFPDSSSGIGLVDRHGARQTLVDQSTMFTAAYPGFSRDGRAIFFTGRERASSAWAIWRINVDRTGLTKLTDLDQPNLAFNGPSVASDGNRVVYSDAKSFDVIVLDPATRTRTSVARGIKGSMAVFSPDGSRVAFLDIGNELIFSGNGYVTIAKVDGTEHKRVGKTSLRHWQNRLTWTKDGFWVLGRAEYYPILVSSTDGEEIVVEGSGDLYSLGLP